MRTALLLLILIASPLAADTPRLFDPRLKLELFAEHPQIVTPTGISIDSRGRVWAIECNTHFPPPGYQGHSSDRIWIFTDENNDGRADKQTLFTDELFATMSIAVRPDGDVYIATRKEIFLMRDTDGDDKADLKQRLFFLETESKYPHDALGGLAFDPLDRLYFGCGENEGQPYKLLGPEDQPVHVGGGEGGNLFRSHLDGSHFEHWSTGFWNPHASTCDPFGNIFTVDNDPDSRPPCRLMHVVPGSDFGYRYRNGRRGTHPFSAWNGELPGTLPMTAGTGEAPSGIIAYEADLLPEEYRGTLLVGSWGDYRIDRFRLTPEGSSYSSQIDPVVKGGDDFRPVGLALAPDGSIYFTDWMKRNYEVHGSGRIWRLSIKDERAVKDARERNSSDVSTRDLLSHPHQSIRREAARELLRRPMGREQLTGIMKDLNAPIRARLEALWGLLRSTNNTERISAVQIALSENRSDQLETAAVRELEDLSLINALYELYFEQSTATTDPGFRLALLGRWNPAVTWRENPQRFYKSFQPNGALERLLDDPYLFGTLRDRLRTTWPKEALPVLRQALESTPRARRLRVLLSRDLAPQDAETAAKLLHDPDPEIRRMGIQWAAEERLESLRPQVESLLSDPETTPLLLQSLLAAIEMYRGTPGLKYEDRPSTELLLPILTDVHRPARLRAFALRLIDPRSAELKPELFRELLSHEELELRTEAVNSLMLSQPGNLMDLLSPILTKDRVPASIQSDGLVALSGRLPLTRDGDPELRIVASFLDAKDPMVRYEALRSLRAWPRDVSLPKSETILSLPLLADDPRWREQIALLRQLTGRTSDYPEVEAPRPATVDEWKQATLKGGNPELGRRVFFHPQGPGCFRCHQVQGRGERIGPDLSTISRSLNREKLQRSILDPSRDVAPQFVTWSLHLRDGRLLSGMIVQENNAKIILGTPEGKLLTIDNIEVEERALQKTSLMPDDLIRQMTRSEFLDLLAYLETLRR